MRNKYQTLAGSTVKLGLGTFGSKVLVFLMVRFYTEHLSPADYGTADLITQTANLLIPLLSLGITDAVFRFVMDETEDAAGVFTAGLFVVLAGGHAGGRACAACRRGAGRRVAHHGFYYFLKFPHTGCAVYPGEGRYDVLRRAGPDQHGPRRRPEHPVSGRLSPRRNRLRPVHRRRRRPDHRISFSAQSSGNLLKSPKKAHFPGC